MIGIGNNPSVIASPSSDQPLTQICRLLDL